MLADVLVIDGMRMVSTDTEAIAPQLLNRLTSLPGCEVLLPRTALNRDIVRKDSL